MKSLDILQELKSPYYDNDGKILLEAVKEKCPEKYEILIQLKSDFELIETDLIIIQGFVSILEADRILYRHRIANKRAKKENYDIEKAILERTEEQLGLLSSFRRKPNDKNN